MVPAFRSKKNKGPGEIFPGGFFFFCKEAGRCIPFLGDTPPGFIA